VPEPRKHHYLPQFYLRHFSSNGRQICQIRKQPRADSYISAIPDTAACRDYNTIDGPGVEGIYNVEKRFAEVESDLAKVVAHALANGIAVADTRENLCFLANLMQLRVPAFKQYIENSHQELLRSITYSMERNGEFEPIDLGNGEVLGVEDIKIEITNWKLLQVMTELAADPDLLSVWNKMNMSLLRAPEGSDIITCDNPVAFYREGAKQSDNYGTGLGHPDVEVTLPLSRSAALKFSWKDEPFDAHISAEEVSEYNRRTVVMADKVVFAPAQSVELLRCVADYSNCNAGFRLNALHHSSGSSLLYSRWPVMPVEEYVSSKSH